MILRAFFFIAVLLGVVGPVEATTAGTPPPDVRPQWLQTYSREIFANDVIASPDGETWTRLPNGEIVLFTATVDGDFDWALLGRRFAPDGTLLQTRLLPFSEIGAFAYQSLIVKYDPVTGDLVVLSGSARLSSVQLPCVLLRFDDRFNPKSSTPINSEGSDDKACVELQLLADGSAIVADSAGLSRVNAGGTIAWSVRNRDNNRYLQPRDILIDASGVIWVASQGALADGSAPRDAAVVRYDVQGTFLSGDYYRCGICVANSTEALERLADGHVIAVGTYEGGSGANRYGFLARYGTDGSREWILDTELYVEYLDVASDADGALYVLTGRFPTSEVRRVDPDDGAVSWAVPAEDFTAAAHGIVVTRSAMPNISVHGYDATGASLWDRVLVTQWGGAISRGRRAGDRVEFLVQTNVAMPNCGLAPRLASFYMSGGETVLAEPCLMPSSTYLNALDALPDVGVMIAVWNRLAAYTPYGDLRWSSLTCEWCVDSKWVRAVLTPDGGAWAIESLSQYGGSELKRIDAGGFVTLSVPVAIDVGAYLLSGTNDRAVVVQGYGHTLSWQQIDLDSGALATQSHALPGHLFQLDSARLLADGSMSVALGPAPCDIGTCPPSPLPSYIVAKLAADGSLAWLTPEGVGVAGFDDAGGANVIAYDGSELRQLRRVTPDGEVEPDIALPDSIRYPQAVYGPHAGRLLLVSYDGPGPATFSSLDAEGHVQASRYLQSRVLDDSPLGLLVTVDSDAGAAAEWIDPVSLETRARFRFAVDGTIDESIGYDPQSWHLLADGSVYGADAHFDAWRLIEPRLARFSAPGYTPTELIFRNGFD